jgi:exopolyphosphatase/pppGpp-phosphohydrolase
MNPYTPSSPSAKPAHAADPAAQARESRAEACPDAAFVPEAFSDAAFPADAFAPFPPAASVQASDFDLDPSEQMSLQAAQVEDSIQAQVEQIRRSKQATNVLLEACMPGYRFAEQCMSGTWELLFDALCQHIDKADLKKVTTLTDAMHRLAMSFSHIKKTEIEIRSQNLKEAIWAQKRKELQSQLRTLCPQVLDPHTLNVLEHQLKLL